MADTPAGTGPASAGDTVEAPARPGLLLLLFVAAFFACCLLAVALPHDRYIRYQQLSESSMYPGLWAYERTTFDKTPIDVAVIGASRVQMAVSAPELGKRLSEQLGRTVHVANFATPHDGRNLQYEMTRQLLSTHPEVKLILFMASDSAMRTGHPMYRMVADVDEMVAAPKANISYFSDLAVLPYRQLTLFLETQAPGLFGKHLAFDPHTYLGTDIDFTGNFRSPRGLVNRDGIISASALRKVPRSVKVYRKRPMLPAWAGDYEFAIERTYMAAANAAARRNGTQVAFLRIPIVTDTAPPADLAYYRAMGPVFSAGFIAADTRSYADFAHLNHHGALRVTDWLADQLAAAQRGGTLDFAPAPASAPKQQ